MKLKTLSMICAAVLLTACGSTSVTTDSVVTESVENAAETVSETSAEETSSAQAEETTSAQETDSVQAEETTAVSAEETAAESISEETVSSETTTTAEETDTVPVSAGVPVYSENAPEVYTARSDDDAVELVRSEYGTLSIDNADVYPELAAAISDFNSSGRDYFNEQCQFLTETAKEDYGYSSERFTGEYSMNYYVNITDFVTRCDDRVFSFLYSEDGFSGGVHGWYYSTGKNYDPQTGKELKLSDICNDIPRLVDILAEKLEKYYSDSVDPEYTGSSNYREVLTNIYGEELMGGKTIYSDETEMELSGMNFVFVPDGIMFFSNPYELTSYAGGTQEPTILFSEAEGLFNEKYVLYGEDFKIKKYVYDDAFLDIDGDKKGEELRVAEKYDDNWKLEGYTITAGDKEYTVDYVPETSGGEYVPTTYELERTDGKYTVRIYRESEQIAELSF